MARVRRFSLKLSPLHVQELEVRLDLGRRRGASSPLGVRGGAGAAGAGAETRARPPRPRRGPRARGARSNETRGAQPSRIAACGGRPRGSAGARAKARGADARRGRDGGHDGSQDARARGGLLSVVRWRRLGGRRDKPPGGRRDRSARGAWRSFDVNNAPATVAPLAAAAVAGATPSARDSRLVTMSARWNCRR